MHCTCGKAGSSGYRAMPDPDNAPWGVIQDFWVCSNCMRPSRLVFEKVTHRTAPKRATSIKSVVGDGEGRNIITWGTDVSGEKIKTMTFQPYPRKVDMPGTHSQGRNVCVELWTGLDSMIDSVRDTSGHVSDETKATEKVRAQLLAKVIALVMSPFYADETAVLAESMVRWKARQEGAEHESPGLAESIWDPATRFDGTPYSRDAVAKARNGGAVAKPAVKFDEQKITFIRHTLENGQMSPEVLAGMFNCTVEDIKAAVG